MSFLRFLLWIVAFNLLVFILTSENSFAAQVEKVKDKKIMLRLDEGEIIAKGQMFYVLDNDGKKKGVIKVGKVKGDRALAKLGKGKAEPGWTIAAYDKKAKKSKSQTSDSADVTTDWLDLAYWGFIAGYGMDTMKATISEGVDTDMSGSGFSAKVLLDYNIFENFWFRGTSGMEQFSVESDDTCTDEACNLTITYLSFDLWGRYLFLTGQYRPWLGGGFSLLFPMSKETNAVDDSSITNTSVMAAGLGIDIGLSKDNYIPVQFEYGMFPSSDDVSATYMALRAGFAMRF